MFNTNTKKQESNHVPVEAVTFNHITLETGHDLLQKSFCPEAGARTQLRSWVNGGVYPLFDGYNLAVTHLSPEHVAFSVHSGIFPIVFCHACLDASAREGVWEGVNNILKEVDAIYSELALAVPPRKKIDRPAGLFLAVSLQPVRFVDLGAMQWLGDFERCFYWALWEHRQAQLRSSP